MRGGGTAITAFATLLAGGCTLSTWGLLDTAVVTDAGAPDGSTPTTTDDASAGDVAVGTTPDATAGDDDGDPGVPEGGDDAGGTDAAPAVDAADAACPAPSTNPTPGTATAISPAPKIDGDLSEWGCGPWTELNRANAAATSGSTSLSATFALRWDKDNLYVAVHSVIATLRGSDPTDPYKNDAVEIYVSGDSPLTGDYDPQSHQYIVDWHGLSVDYGTLAYPPNQPTKNPPHVVAKVKQVTDGWQLEAAIGWAVLIKGPAAAGTPLGFDLQLDDGDGVALDTLILATLATHAACGCQRCCCNNLTNDFPNCDTLDYGALTLQ